MMIIYNKYPVLNIDLVVGKLYQTKGTIRGICNDDNCSELTFDIHSYLMLTRIELLDDGFWLHNNNKPMMLSVLYKKNTYAVFFDFTSKIHHYMSMVC